MFSTKFQTLFTVLTLLPFTPFVEAHGQLRGVTIAGKWYDAPNLYYDGDGRNGNTPIRKGYKADFPSYLLPNDFNNDNKMACQEAGAAPAVAQVNAGDEVKWQWEGATHELENDGWPTGTFVHAMGPIITYIGSCNGDCKSVDASQIGWQKIDFAGLNPGNIIDHLRSSMEKKPEPYRSDGLWALASMIENGSSYTSKIPSGLKKGQYMLRSELAAVHNPWNGNYGTGPQNYVGCLQVEVVNGGDTELPYGTKAGSLYATDGDLAHYSVFTSPASFPEVGPGMWNGASGSSQPPAGNSGNQGGNTDNNNNNNGGNQNQGSNDQNNNNNNGSNQNQGGDNNNNNQGGNTDNNNNGGGSYQGSNDNHNDQNNNNGGEQNQNQGQEGQNLQGGSSSGDNSNSNNNGGEQNQGSNGGNGNGTTAHCRRRRSVGIKGRSVVKRHLESKRRH
ncbi:hypothetical protein AAF712_006169 [Marasmius tenuissimus]|uniref:Auxiliary Activity family 9 catalytic domain-containing protein n=1 Tax=Marasmius tenuissimus TaxID=585030 RepID=A0ABR3A2G6_9AGAR